MKIPTIKGLNSGFLRGAVDLSRNDPKDLKNTAVILTDDEPDLPDETVLTLAMQALQVDQARQQPPGELARKLFKRYSTQVQAREPVCEAK